MVSPELGRAVAGSGATEEGERGVGPRMGPCRPASNASCFPSQLGWPWARQHFPPLCVCCFSQLVLGFTPLEAPGRRDALRDYPLPPAPVREEVAGLERCSLWLFPTEIQPSDFAAFCG